MTVKHIVFAALTMLTACGAPAADAPSSTPSSKPLPAMTDAPSRTYAQNYKDSALAFCIAKAYQAEPRAKADAVATAGGLDTWTSYDLENSTGEIPKLVERYLAREYSSKQGPDTRLDLMKCIDMYHGKELAALVKKYVLQPTHTYNQDNPPTKP